MSYLDDLFAGKKPEGRHFVRHNRWEWEDYETLADDVHDFSVAEDDLAKITPVTASAAMADVFFSMEKYRPNTENIEDLRPSHRINGAVFKEMMGLPNHAALRAWTLGDPVGAALATVSIEPELEVLFDKAKKAQEKAGQLEQLLTQWGEKRDQTSSLEQEIDKALESGEDIEAELATLDTLQSEMQDLENQAYQDEASLAQDIDAQLEGMADRLAASLGVATDKAENEASGMQAWSPTGGSLSQVDPKKRIEFAKQLDTPTFRDIANAFGKMHRLMLGEQRDKIIDVPHEVVSVELGNDLTRMLPYEHARRRHPRLHKLWKRDFIERRNQQYQMSGSEKAAKGGIVICVDNSGSMHGGPLTASKGLAITLLHLCRLQKRPFTAIDFAGEGRATKWTFETTKTEFSCDTGLGHFEGPEAVLAYAGSNLRGGTSFITPINIAVAQLQAEFDETKATTGDIVFVTDGRCAVPSQWMTELKATQARLGFRIYGFAFGGHASNPLLQKLCDGRVVGLKDLLAEADTLRPMFREM